MAAYDTLRAAIDNYIKANGNKEITGTILNDILNAMVTALGADTRFAGVATPSTNPGNPEGNVIYFASQAGTYSNFGSIVLPLGIHILLWNGTTWTSQTWFTVDQTPTQNSQNLVTSGGILQAIVDAVGVERLRAIGAEVTSCSFNGTTKKISFFNSANTTLFQLDATAFVIDGMVSDVKIEDGNLVIKFNTDAGKQDIEIPITEIFNPDNYYTKTAIDTLLQSYYTKTQIDNLLTAINSRFSAGYLYKGVATPATNPSTPTEKVFYITTTAGTYTYFLDSKNQPIVVKEGEAILKYDGTSWSLEQYRLTDGGVFNVTAYSGSSFASLDALLSDENLNNLIPVSVRKGGMSIKFVQSSDNKYVQARCMAQNFTTDVTQWQGVDDEPTAGSNNLVKSGGVFANIKMLEKEIAEHGGVPVELSPTYISNKYISTTGTVESASGYSYSQPIALAKGDAIRIISNGGLNYSLLSEVITEDTLYSPILTVLSVSDREAVYIASRDINIAISGLSLQVYQYQYISPDYGNSARIPVTQRLFTRNSTLIPECDTDANVAAKTINIDAWANTVGAHHIIRMRKANTTDNATMSVNGGSPKPLWYHNIRVSSTNTYKAARRYILLDIGTDYLLGDFDWEGCMPVSSFGVSNSPVSQSFITNLLARDPVCSTNENVSIKEITINDWQTTAGVHHYIKMANNNTADDVTLSVNGGTPKPLYYHNLRVSSINSPLGGRRYLLYYNGSEYLLGDFDWEGCDKTLRIPTLTKTTWVATIRNYILKEETVNGQNLLYHSSDLGKTWTEGIVNTIGDIMFVHWFNDGTCLICGTQKAYWTKDWDELHESTVYDIDGSIFTPAKVTDRHFFADCTYNSPYQVIDGKETAIWGDYGPGNGTYEQSGYLGRMWMSDDNGHTVKCILKSGVGVLSAGIRHFHWVQWDKYDNCLWATTGDTAEESMLLRGTINSGVWTFTIVRSGADCKYGQVFVDDVNIYLITDFTEGGNNTGIVFAPKSKANNPSEYHYLYRNVDNVPFGSLFDDGAGHRLLTTDSSRTKTIFYSDQNFEFESKHIELADPVGINPAISSIYGMNYNGDGILLAKPRPTSYEVFYPILCLNMSDRYNFFAGMKKANYEFKSPLIKALIGSNA